MSMTTAEVYVPIEAPPIAPRPYGLFSVAPPSDGAERWRVGVGWQSVNCMEAGVWQDVCINGGAAAPKTVTDWNCDVAIAEPFTVYLLAHRTGVDFPVAASDTSTAFEGAEERAVEAQLWAAMVADAANGGAHDNLAQALATVEGNLAVNYNGRGVIHLSPYSATMLAAWLEPDGDRQYTRGCRTPVVVGAGYGDSQTPTVEIIGTGAVFVRRGELNALDAWDLSSNDITALAERSYLAGWDCYAIRSTVTEAP